MLIPIEETHRAALQNKASLSQLEKTLGERTEELAASHREVRQGIAQRKGMDIAARKNGRQHDRCLAESLELQKHLRELTHQVLAAQEDGRKKMSHEFQDGIAQTLLGINVRLLSLKQKARSDTKGLKNEIASAQRLVVNSAKSVRRYARTLAAHSHTQTDRAISIP